MKPQRNFNLQEIHFFLFKNLDIDPLVKNLNTKGIYSDMT